MLYGLLYADAWAVYGRTTQGAGIEWAGGSGGGAQLRRQADHDPVSGDLEHDRRKPSDKVLVQLAKVLKVESDVLYFLAGRVPADLTAESIISAQGLAAAWKAFRREVKRRK